MTFKAYNYSTDNQAISNIHITTVAACSAAFTPVLTDNYTDATAAPTCSDAATDAANADTNAANRSDPPLPTNLEANDAGCGWWSW